MTTTEPERVTPTAATRAAQHAASRRQSPERPTHSVLDDTQLAIDTATSITAQRLRAWQATVPRRFWRASLADFGPPWRDDLETWSATETPPNLVLLGAVGVGKTHAAIAACSAPFDRGATMAFCPVGELLDSLDWRRPDSATTMQRLCDVDLLVVDDLGTERSNEWTGERLYLVVNHRWLNERPTIVTSNLDRSGLVDAIGERTYSRLADSATALQFTGKDRRRG